MSRDVVKIQCTTDEVLVVAYPAVMTRGLTIQCTALNWEGVLSFAVWATKSCNSKVLELWPLVEEYSSDELYYEKWYHDDVRSY